MFITDFDVVADPKFCEFEPFYDSNLMKFQFSEFSLILLHFIWYAQNRERS